MDIQQKVHLLMTKYGYSPAQFADQLGVPRSSISHVMSGRNKPSLEFIRKLIARFPETDLYWLLDVREPKEPQTNSGDKTSENTHWSLFDHKNLPHDSELGLRTKQADSSIDEVRNESTSALRKPVRVVLFYKDGTFESFQN
jgi:transcriptional regulator with XRE-family HTH domain